MAIVLDELDRAFRLVLAGMVCVSAVAVLAVVGANRLLTQS